MMELLYIGLAVAIVLVIRAFLKSLAKTEVENQYNDILDSPEYKVKGKFES